MNKEGHKSYRQILKSSALIGGSSAANVAFGIVRVKAMALLLGPSGVGLLGLYGSVLDVARTVTGMGINGSGVREIAGAVSAGDAVRIARIVTALRRVVLFLGLLGAVLVAALCEPISVATFGDDSHTGGVALLAFAVFFATLSAAQGALVQGMRRIADLAKLNVLGAFFGTVFGVVIVYFARQHGIALSLVCVAGMSLASSWWFARRIKVEHVSMTAKETLCEASELLKLGFALMAGVLLTMLSAYFIRIIVGRQISFEAIGFYQAAWALGGLYVGFILEAMGADFYPRLTAAGNDNAESNRLVNEQAEVGLLLAGPGLLLTLTFAPLVIQIFYSAKFQPATEILRWVCLAMFLRVVAWPMGFIVLARGKRNLFLITQLSACALHVGLVWVGVQMFGLVGAGMAFFCMYLVHSLIAYGMGRYLSGFRWSVVNRRTGFFFAPLIVLVFGTWYVLSHAGVMVVGVAATLIAGIYSMKRLCVLIPLERLPGLVQKIIGFLRLAPLNSPIEP